MKILSIIFLSIIFIQCGEAQSAWKLRAEYRQMQYPELVEHAVELTRRTNEMSSELLTLRKELNKRQSQHQKEIDRMNRKLTRPLSGVIMILILVASILAAGVAALIILKFFFFK